MITHTDEHQSLCAGHVLRNQHETERRRWSELMALDCPECAITVGRLQEAALVVARSAPLRAQVVSDALMASAGGAERAMSTPRPVATPAVKIGVGVGGWIIVYMAAALIALLIYHNVTVRKLQADIASLTQRVAQISAAMVEAARWEVTVGPGARVVSMRPHRVGVGARATVFFDPQSRRTLIAGSELVPASGGRFIAWAMGNGAPVPIGVLAPDRSGTAVLRVDPPAAATAIHGFEVSHEPLATTMPTAPSDVLLEAQVND
jgi:hypothetical protein